MSAASDLFEAKSEANFKYSMYNNVYNKPPVVKVQLILSGICDGHRSAMFTNSFASNKPKPNVGDVFLPAPFTFQ